jgi:small-conductance mechanosensitive channel
MDFARAIYEEARSAETLYVLAVSFLAGLVVHRDEAHERRRVRTIFFLAAVHIILVLIAGFLSAAGSSARRDVHAASLAFAALAIVTAAGAIVFFSLLPRLRLRVPRIVHDVATAGVGLVSLLVVASRAGLNLSSVIATSAVLTAVIGFSLQDTLGNMIGGLALQTDDSIRVGDWVKVGDVSGRVTEIRWRYTAIETRNWETVFVPNSVLVKNQVTVQGRRRGQPTQWRRWVWFNVDHRFAPTAVIEAVNTALVSSPIPNVASEPVPHAIVMEFAESWARYAVRYWLTDLAADDPTDNLVRQRLYFALKRARIPLSMPAQAVFLTKENQARELEQAREDSERRMAALARIDLFAKLPEADRTTLAGALHFAPFTKGEAMTRQGATAHWLYAITKGSCSVRVSVNGTEREVAVLGAGDFFGEMGLLTGAAREATVVATTDVEAWRLDRAAFQRLLQDRPEVSQEVAGVLAERLVGLESVRDHLSEEAMLSRTRAERERLSDKILDLFGLSADRTSARPE